MKRLILPPALERLIAPADAKRLLAGIGLKRLIPLLAATAVGAAVLLRPVPPPPASAGGWSSAPLDPRADRARRTPVPQAMVYVAGDVVRPGVYPVRAEARTRDALALAGGARPDADLVAVNLAAHVRDGDEIVVPVRGATCSTNTAPGPHRRGRGGGRRGGAPHRGARAGTPVAGGTQDTNETYDATGSSDARSTRAGDKKRHRRSYRGQPPLAEVDVNTADADTLASVPGVGEGLAKRIVTFREQNGAFASVDELLDVAGITEHRLDAMLPYVVAR